MDLTPAQSPQAPWGDPHAYWATLDAATRHLCAPVGVLSAEALEHNAAEMARRAGGTPIRLATKSLRLRPLIAALLRHDAFAGAFAYSLREAIWLVRTGTTDDVVVGYPSVDRGALAELARDPALASAITLMVDDPAQLDLVDAVAAPGRRETIRVCLDLDASLATPLGYLGTWRSPLRSVRDVRLAAEHIVARPGFALVGLLAYEAQVAGYPDEARSARAHRRWRSHVIGAMHRVSVREIAERRAAAVAAVSALTPLEFVNGGGTGSLETTSAEAVVTEIAAGSGLLAPALFDLFSQFELAPAASFGLDVVRRPARGMVTVLGGGWIASGPPNRNRAPVPVWPAGLEYLRTEGAGEVQTPLTGADAELRPGDRVWFRHAKAGELCEHLNALHLVRGGEVVEELLTYRGEGMDFL